MERQSDEVDWAMNERYFELHVELRQERWLSLIGGIGVKRFHHIAPNSLVTRVAGTEKGR